MESGINSENWRNYAECRKGDPELFFPLGETKQYHDQIEKAKKICSACGAAALCLEYALSTSENQGIWGGLTEDERKALKRRAHRARRMP
jgi:WhiB family redox-sensing transcriptional regulator